MVLSDDARYHRIFPAAGAANNANHEELMSLIGELEVPLGRPMEEPLQVGALWSLWSPHPFSSSPTADGEKHVASLKNGGRVGTRPAGATQARSAEEARPVGRRA